MKLRLAPDLAKLSKLNKINIERTAVGRAQKEEEKKGPLDGEQPLTGRGWQAQGERQQRHSQRLDMGMVDGQDASSCIEVFGSMQCDPTLQAAIRDVEQGFRMGLKPKLTDDGTSGTYLLRGKAKRPLAVFKPIDEEAFAPNNPRDHVGPFGSMSFRAGVLSGEACIREVAAYLLDKDGFSGVPPTTMVETAHESLRTFKFSSF